MNYSWVLITNIAPFDQILDSVSYNQMPLLLVRKHAVEGA